MTQKKVEVIPATKRSVHNGGQLKVQSNIRVVRLSRREKYIATEYERFLRPQNATPLSAVWSKAILLPTM